MTVTSKLHETASGSEESSGHEAEEPNPSPLNYSPLALLVAPVMKYYHTTGTSGKKTIFVFTVSFVFFVFSASFVFFVFSACFASR